MAVFFLKVSWFFRYSDKQQTKSEKHAEGLSDIITCWATKKKHNALKKDTLFNSWFNLQLTNITKELEDIFDSGPEWTKFLKTIRGKTF